MDLPTPRIAVGEPANLCLVDLDGQLGGRRGRLREPVGELLLRGAHLRGRVLLTLAAGGVAFRQRAFAIGPA